MKKAKAVLDTSVLLAHFRKGDFVPNLQELNFNYHLCFSSVVLMELYSGAFKQVEAKLIDYISNNFSIVTPTENNWLHTGKILKELQTKKLASGSKLKMLVPDILIALSANNIGAVVITMDYKDFNLIHSLYKFKLLEI